MIGKTVLWLSKMGLALMVATALLACSMGPDKQSANTESTNTLTHAVANNGTIIQSTASWAVHYGTVDDLVKAADLIIKGKVMGIAQTYVDKGLPFTNFNVEVEQVLKGSANATILIRQTGGTATDPGLETSDDPLLVLGKTYFFFLAKGDSGRYIILGGPQGRFEVINGQVFSLSAIYHDREIADLGVAGTALTDFSQQVIKSIQVK